MTNKDFFITFHILPTNFQLSFQVQNFSQVINYNHHPPPHTHTNKKEKKNTTKIKWMYFTVKSSICTIPSLLIVKQYNGGPCSWNAFFFSLE